MKSKFMSKNTAGPSVQLAALTVDGTRPILGSFGKGTKGSVSLNFGTSGGDNCPTECPYHPASTSDHAEPTAARCYAATCENRPDRQNLLAKLQRAENVEGRIVIMAAMRELDRRQYTPPWFRFSTFGSVPITPPEGLRELVQRLLSGTVHLPIFGADTVASYRAAIGDIVTVRESVPIADVLAGHHTGHVSAVVGSMESRPAERLDEAKALQQAERARGRRAVVCPAIAATMLRTGSKAAKCGNCRACAIDTVDTILYPVHR
jgi:hypothetical protein